MDWFEIFRSGTHTDSSGRTRNWSHTDLDKTVSSYKPENHEAPAVIGHPKDNGPAYGWVEGLRRVGDVLFAKLKQVEPQFSEMVKAGRFKKRSASFYPDGSLRHIGFLGAQSPAIKGLADVKFADDEEFFEYEENTEGFQKKPSKEDNVTIEELEKQLAEEKKKRVAAEKEAKENKEKADKGDADHAEEKKKQHKKDIKDFVEKGINDGKILPAWKATGMTDFMMSLGENDTAEYEFSEGKKETKLDWFKGFLSSFAENPLFKEMVPPVDKKQSDDVNINDFMEKM